MNCKRFQEQYDLYAAQELSASASSACEQHLAQCHNCREWTDVQQLVRQALRESAQNSLPPEHYYEGLFQRIAPRLTRLSRWERLRQRIMEPFAALVFSSRLLARASRTLAICAIGVAIGLAIQANGFQLWSHPRSTSNLSRSAELTRISLDQVSAVWSKASNALQQAITPQMDAAQSAPASSSATAANYQSEFQNLNDLKYSFVRDGKFDLLPQLNKVESELLASGRISARETANARRQSQLILMALQHLARKNPSQAQTILNQALPLDQTSQWACLGGFLQGVIHEEMGQRAAAIAYYRACVDHFPHTYLNEQQRLYVEKQLNAEN